MVYWSDVPESPGSMVVGTRCNFACLPSMVAKCYSAGAWPKLTKGPYSQLIFVQFREYLKSTIMQLLLHKIMFGSLGITITISC
jgi:hypothetical protein